VAVLDCLAIGLSVDLSIGFVLELIKSCECAGNGSDAADEENCQKSKLAIYSPSA